MGTTRMQPEALQRASASSPVRMCTSLTGNAAWWTDDVLACVGASGLLAFIPTQGNSIVAERFSAGARLASSGSTASSGVRLFVIEPVLQDATVEQRIAATSSLEQPAGWGSTLTRLLSISAADDLSDTAVFGGKQLAGWRLSLVDSRTPHDMLNGLLQRRSWAAAFELCSTHSLPSEPVHRARWLAEPVTLRTLQVDLALVTDRRWAVEQLLQRTAQDEATQRMLLSMALEEIDRCHSSLAPSMGDAAPAGAAAAEADFSSAGEGEALWWLCKRLQALQRLDRLDTLCAMLDG